ncbi:hypothetical protein [Thiomicrorhabdus sp.]|uniref:hypothetical protein n=1 Tax=Thiomicrorhabdus sp. TaxID=2039724 RepID=UPI0035690621
MAKRMNKAEVQAIFWLVVIALPVLIMMKLGESIGWGVLALLVALGIGFYIWFKSIQIKKRKEYLKNKYQDDELVENLMAQKFWQGQTSQQLLDSIGQPSDIDQKILKTKKKEVWKYNHQGGNRYGLRITLDDDYVVGWDQKS